MLSCTTEFTAKRWVAVATGFLAKVQVLAEMHAMFCTKAQLSCLVIMLSSVLENFQLLKFYSFFLVDVGKLENSSFFCVP
jgi:hypothetical protein